MPLVGDNIGTVLQWARTMHQEGQIDPAAQSENGSTFAQQFGSGRVGIMGTGNFNAILAKQQNPNIEFGITLLPGLETGQVASFAGGDIVAIPKGSKRVADAVDFERFILSPEIQVEVYSKNGDLTTRSDMADNQYSRVDPYSADLSRGHPGVAHAVHAEVLRAHQLAAGSVAADAAARVLHQRRPRADHRRCAARDDSDRLQLVAGAILRSRQCST